MDMRKALGFDLDQQDGLLVRQQLHLYINLKLASCGQPSCVDQNCDEFMAIAQDLLHSYQEKSRRLANAGLYPPDYRIQSFLDSYLADLNLTSIPRLPATTFELDGMV